jgi:hypothetical protein
MNTLKILVLVLAINSTALSQSISPFRSAPINIKAIPTTSSWTWPGNIGDHLLLGHGLTKDQISHLSTSEKIKLHNYLHNMGIEKKTTVMPTKRRLKLFQR